MSDIEQLLEGRARDLGEGFVVRRVLPAGQRNMLGPFIFLDQMGPVSFPPGPAINVRPHPHTALSTVTYLFEGEILHRDSLGTLQEIHAGDVNWMVAGRGIVHSERTTPSSLRDGVRLHGMQSWVALPDSHIDTAPAFQHHPRGSMPTLERGRAQLRIIVGDAYGLRSPVITVWPTLYVDAVLPAEARFEIGAEHEERGVYVASGHAEVAGAAVAAGSLAVLRPGRAVSIRGIEDSRLMLLGGARFPTPRLISWNFVSPNPEHLAHARADWQNRNRERFPDVPGDDQEWIPLP